MPKLTNATFRMHLREALKSPIVRTTGLAAIVCACVLIVAGNTKFFASEHASDWTSALASLLATFVALGLGLYAVRQDGRREQKRTIGATWALHAATMHVIVLLEAIEAQYELMDADAAVTEMIRRDLIDIAPLLSSDVLDYLACMPEDLVSDLVHANQRLVSVRLMLSKDRTHESTAQTIRSSVKHLKARFLPLGTKLFERLVGDSRTPPWLKDVATEQAQGS